MRRLPLNELTEYLEAQAELWDKAARAEWEYRGHTDKFETLEAAHQKLQDLAERCAVTTSFDSAL